MTTEWARDDDGVGPGMSGARIAPPIRYTHAMRITDQQHTAIIEAARHAFGDSVTVRLFGSRVQDQRKGGDFDLYVECDSDDAEWLTRAKLKFLAELDKSPALSGEKVDIVLSTPLHRESRAIDRIARLEGVQL